MADLKGMATKGLVVTQLLSHSGGVDDPPGRDLSLLAGDLAVDILLILLVLADPKAVSSLQQWDSRELASQALALHDTEGFVEKAAE